MTSFFNRAWSLKITAQDSSFSFEIKPDQFGNALRIQFDINAAIDFRYYSGTIKIFNLNRDKRKKLMFNILADQLGTGPLVELKAGYERKNGLIFSGAIQRGYTIREPSSGDWISNLQVGLPWNGSKEVTVAGIDINSSNLKSWLFSEIEKLIKQTGLAGVELAKNFQANLNTAIDEYLNVGNVKNKSLAYHGTASSILEEISKEFNILFFTDQGKFNVVSGRFKSSTDIRNPVVIPPGNTVPEKVLNKTNGLLGSPVYTDTGAKARTFLMPDLRVLQLVRIESEVLQKNISITDLKHVGDTYENEWYSELDGSNFNQFAR